MLSSQSCNAKTAAANAEQAEANATEAKRNETEAKDTCNDNRYGPRRLGLMV